MANVKDKIEAQEQDGAQEQSSDPAYLAWRDEKVRKALAEAKEHPERRVSQEEVWKKFGLE